MGDGWSRGVVKCYRCSPPLNWDLGCISTIN